MSDLRISPRGLLLVQAATLVAAALFVYWPALSGGWLFDDELDVTGNRLLRDAAGLWKIWFQPVGLYDYYPIKYSVQWLQWQLWQTDTLGYHVTNVALHVAGALLFWRILHRLGVRHGWLGGLLFTVHPLAVESVAWITELKNTLSLPLLLLAFLKYLDFDEHGRRADFVAALSWFLASLLCKTAGVMFPVTLLLYAWWRHGRVRTADVKASIPFFALSLALGLVTIWFQQQRALGEAAAAFNPVGGPLARIACAGSSLAFYFWKTIFPTDLMMIYPQWPVDPPSAWLFVPWLVLATIVIGLWRRPEPWARAALFGLGWFVLHLVPVLGFVPISSQRFTWVMDHLAYFALLGPIGLVVAAIEMLEQRILATGRPRFPFVPFVTFVACLLAVVSRHHSATYRSEEALWSHTVSQNPGAWMALYNLGNIAGQAGRAEDAIRWYRQAIAARANYPEAWNNLGNELRNQGKHTEAIAAYEQAIQLKPDHFAAHNNLGASLAAIGRVDEAIARCEQALRLNPRFAPAHRNLGAIYSKSTGDLENGIAHLREALRLQPDFPEAEFDLGLAQVDAGRAAEAIQHFRRVITLQPGNAAAHSRLGTTLLAEGQTADAVRAFEAAVKIDPQRADAHFGLGNAHAAAGDNATALAHFDRATQVQPRFAEAHHNAGVILTRLGRAREAVDRFKAALAIKPDYSDAHLNLALAYQALGQMAEAVAHYEAARKLRPELPPLQR